MHLIVIKVKVLTLAHVQVNSINLKIINGMSSVTSTRRACIALPFDSEVRDLKIADDNILIITLIADGKFSKKAVDSELTSCTDETKLLYIPYQQKHASGDLEFQEIGSDILKLDLTTTEMMEPYVKHLFSRAGHLWKPSFLELNGRKGRRAICVVSQDKLRYALLDMDSSHDPEIDEDEITDEN